MHRRTFVQAPALSAICAGPRTPAMGAASTGPASAGASAGASTGASAAASTGEPAGASAGPVAFTIEGRVKPGREAEFLDLLHPVLDAMRHEPTFIDAVLHQDPADPTRFLLYETWADLDDVRDVQLHRPYRQAFAERLPELLAAERVIGVWRPLRTDRAACQGPR